MKSMLAHLLALAVFLHTILTVHNLNLNLDALNLVVSFDPALHLACFGGFVAKPLYEVLGSLDLLLLIFEGPDELFLTGLALFNILSVAALIDV